MFPGALALRLGLLTPFLVSAALAGAAALVAASAGRLAGLPPRAPLGPSPGRRGAETVRLFAALAALPLATGGTGGDVLVAGVLAAAAVGRRSPPAGLTLVLLGAVPALRVGSSLADEVGGAAAVLGPGVLSPSAGVAAAAALAGLAALAATAAVLAPPVRGGPGAVVRTPGAVADALVPLLVLLLGLAAAGGPLLMPNQEATGRSIRAGVVVAGVCVAVAFRRWGGPRRADVTATAAALVAVGGVAVALVTL